MPFIRNIKTDQSVVTLFGGEISLEYGETARVSSARLASSEVQTQISNGNIKEVSSLGFVEGFIKGQWDMGASTALPPGAQPGYVYEVTTAAVHPSSGDSFNPGDLASIGTDGVLVRNMTNTLNSGGGGVGQYTWVQISSNYAIQDNEYVLANSTSASFGIILPASPALGTTVGVYPSTSSFTTNPVTVLRNGSPIQGLADDMLLDENIGVSLLYVAGTIGWLVLPIDDTVVFIQDLQADSYYTVENVAGASYTLVPNDSGKVKVFDEAGGVTVTLPQQSTYVLPQGFYVSLRNKQGGPITLATEGADVLVGSGSVTNDSTKLNSVYLEETGSPNTWVSVGDYSTVVIPVFSPLDLSPTSWVRSTISTMYQDDAGTTPMTGSGQDVGLRVDQSGNGNDWVQVTAGARPTYDGTALVYGSGDALVMTVPSGGLAGTFVQATTEGVIVGTFSRPAGTYSMPRNPYYPLSVQNDVGQLYFDRVLTAPEIANLVQWLKDNEGAGSGVYTGSWLDRFKTRSDIVTLDGSTIDVSAVTSFNSAWEGCSGLTSFPLLDVSAGTNFSWAWRECSGLTSFPLLDVSLGTDFSHSWEECSGLTSFPLLNVSAGTNFSFAWFGCTGLTSFPSLDVSAGTDFSNSWRDCASLTSFPSLNVSAGITFESAWEGCSSLTTFPANFFDGCTATNFSYAFSFTNLTQTSIDNILVSINSNGTSNGTFNQSGGSAPSATGEAAIDAMRSRGWTVTVTGGY